MFNNLRDRIQAKGPFCCHPRAGVTILSYFKIQSIYQFASEPGFRGRWMIQLFIIRGYRVWNVAQV